MIVVTLTELRKSRPLKKHFQSKVKCAYNVTFTQQKTHVLFQPQTLLLKGNMTFW